MTLWFSLYIYSPNDRVWEKSQEVFGLNHKLLESFKLFLEAIILFMWEVTCVEKKLWLFKPSTFKGEKPQKKNKIVF